MVLPITASTDSADHLVIGGCDTVDLAGDFGTPLFVFDEETLVTQCREYMACFADGPTPVEVIYAGKAFMSLALCQLIAREGLSVDVSSGGELYVALATSFPPERIYMHGNNKTSRELEMALEHDVGTIVVDSFDEIRLLDSLATAAGKRQKVFIRLTPGIKPQTHEYIQTGQVDSKFGFGTEDGLALEAVKKLLSLENLELTGFHSHIGSQIFALDVRRETGFMPRKINLGGGLGIKYKAEDQPPTIAQFAQSVFEAAAAAADSSGLPLPELAIEPGRSIVGQAGVTLYRIGTVKEIPGVRTYISVDGGMSDNIRPMLYGAEYTALLANRVGAVAQQEVTIAGKHCESGDVLIRDIKLPKMEVGDILCTPATGAYGYAMANNFNLQPKPAVVMVRDGQARVIVERETYEDLIRKQQRLVAGEES